MNMNRPTRPLVVTKRRLPPMRRQVTVSAELPRRAPLPSAVSTRSGWALNGYAGQQHVVLTSGIVNDVQFYRCRCGFLLVESGISLFWIPTATSMTRLETPEQLATVLLYTCGRWRKDQ